MKLMRLVETPLLEIAVEEEGPAEGRPVLLLHGWPDAPRGWRQVARLLHELGWRTIVPALRGSGATRFLSADSPRDGRGVALAADALELLDTLGPEDRVRVVGHDWGARRLHSRRGRPRARRRDRGPRTPLPAARRIRRPAVRAGARVLVPVAYVLRRRSPRRRRRPYRLRAHPVGDLEPPGRFEPEEFEETARSFANPDWVAITLQAYRSRFLEGEVRDARYEPMARRLAEVERIATPTLIIQGADDRCDVPAASAGQERFFVGGYCRVVLEGVGHFPHREAPGAVATAVDEHLRSADR